MKLFIGIALWTWAIVATIALCITIATANAAESQHAQFCTGMAVVGLSKAQQPLVGC